MATERKLFKDWFDEAAARRLGEQVRAVFPDFELDSFVAETTEGLTELEMMGRVGRLADGLATALPDAPADAIRILADSLPEVLVDCESVTDGWLQWPVGQFIAERGLDCYEVAMEAMVELTQRFSSEFAVRPFVENLPDRTFADLLALTDHPSPHVRRWCSEGTRPRLPWGRKLQALVADPTPIWPILEALKDDPELYVRRSVANNLNDIAKDHPDAVVDCCRRWMVDAGAERTALVKHALRSLVKDGHSGALDALGYGPPTGLDARLEVEPREVAIGERVQLRAVISSQHGEPQKLVVDYGVEYVRKAGPGKPKVFKWGRLDLGAGQTRILEKRHAMKPTTIRALYPGRHGVRLQINGQVVAESAFVLNPARS